MDVEPSGESYSPEGQHRRRRQSTWQKTPRGVKIAGAVCLGLLALSIAVGGWIISWSQSQGQAKSGQPLEQEKKVRLDSGKAFDEVASKLQPFDLELSGTALNPATRKIEGNVWNKSERAYTDIKIMFALPSSDLTAQDSTTVTVPKLGPGARAKFASDRLPDGVRQWALVHMSATPAKAAPK
jgi:hypothetical protein